MKLTNDQKNIITIAVVGGVALYLIGRQAAKAASAVGEAINPINHDNIFNRGFNAVFQAVTGDNVNTFGTWLYDKLNPEIDLTVRPDDTKQPADKNKSTPPLIKRPETVTPGVEDFLKDIYKVPK